MVADPDTVPKSMSTPEDHPETDEAAAKRLPDRARAHAGVLATNPLPALVPSAPVLSRRECPIAELS
jgi:hypothetical protein